MTSFIFCYWNHSRMNHVSREDKCFHNKSQLYGICTVNKREPQVSFQASPDCDCGLIIFVYLTLTEYLFYLNNWDAYQITRCLV